MTDERNLVIKIVKDEKDGSTSRRCKQKNR